MRTSIERKRLYRRRRGVFGALMRVCRELRANDVTALYDTKNRPLQRHLGIREARVNGGCQCLSVAPILWLQVTSLDKRIDLPRSLPRPSPTAFGIFGACEKDGFRCAGVFGSRVCGVGCGEKGIILPISFMRLSVHCQSPELQHPAGAGKVARIF